MIRAAGLAVLLLCSPARAQYGQNHVVVRDFKWKVRSTEHFDIYYYEDSKPMVEGAAELLERSFKRVTKLLDIETEPPIWAPAGARRKPLWERRPLFLYASPNDFEQSNIADVGDGTGGITEPFKNRFMVYNNGERQWIHEVIPHEFTHIMQYYVLLSGWWKTGQILKTIAYPLWFIEGMPDFVTVGAEPAIEESLVRDAATSNGLIPLTRLEHFGHLKPHQVTLAYHEGAEAMDFLASQYGERKIGDMLRYFESRLETSRVLLDLIGIDAFVFDAKFREYEAAKYRREVRVNRLREPTAFGGQLTFTHDNIPQFNSAPAFSPDGRTMYFLSTRRDLDPAELWSLDLRTGKQRRLPGILYGRFENLPMGNFANLSRVLDISRDGRWLTFAATKNHSDSIYVYDLRAGRLETIALPGFETINQPAFSPDGRLIAFSGMKNSYTDIYLYDRTTREVRQLTDDINDDQMPYFLPDGSAVIYSQEESAPVAATDYERRLYKVDLRTGTLTRLEHSGGQARDPVVAGDGRTVLFTLDDGKFSDVCELDLASGRVTRLTRTVGSSFTPAYGPDGRIAFASLRAGNVHIYLGGRSDFLAEEVPPEVREVPGDVKFMLPGMGSVGASTSTVALSAERPYKFTYSTDLFLPAFFYSSVGGFFWTSYWQGSDLLGNHQQSALVDIHSAQDFDYQLTSSYGRFRPQLVAQATGIGVSQIIDPNTGDVVDDAYHQQAVGAAYPFDRYHRAEAYLISATERTHDETTGFNDDHEARMGQVALVRDTVTGRYLVAERGNRLRLSYTKAAQTLGGNRTFYEGSAEAQQFVRLGNMDALALRLYGAQTLGRDAPQLIAGGLGGVRGYARSDIENAGNRILVGTAEWRFPVLPDLNYYMWYFFPDFYFKAIFGTLFTDAAISANSQGELQQTSWGTVKNSIGVGLRVYTFILQQYPLVVAMDWAQRTTSNGGIFYVYLGQSF